MTEEAEAPPAPEEKQKGGGALKTVLIVVIVIILVGAVGAIYILLPERVPEMKTYQWPPEGEDPLEVSASLHDQSAILLTSVRFETVPCDLDDLQQDIINEFKAKKSVIESILTEVAIGLDSEQASNSAEFKRQVIRRVNEELTVTEVERILLKDWMLPPAE